MRDTVTAGAIKENTDTYADRLVFAQTIPGFTSCQVAWGVGQTHAGVKGGLAALTGYVLPSGIIMILFGLAAALSGGTRMGWAAGVWHGFASAAVILFGTAIVRLWPRFAPDALTSILAVISALVVWLLPDAQAQIGLLIAAGLLGAALNLKPADTIHFEPVPIFDRHRAKWGLFLALLIILVLPWIAGDSLLGLIAAHARAGLVIFGDGLVVLPALEAELGPRGFVMDHDVVSAFGLAQGGGLARPSLGVFTGTAGALAYMPPFIAPFIGVAAGLALVIPSILLAAILWPTWHRWQNHTGLSSALVGVKAALAGILAAAFLNPVLSSGLDSIGDAFLIGLGIFAVLRLKCPPWLLLASMALIGTALRLT